MIRGLVSLCCAFLLSGCWVSKTDLFADRPLSDSGFEGEYTFNFNAANPARRVSVFRSGPGGLDIFRHEGVDVVSGTSPMRTIAMGDGYFLGSEVILPSVPANPGEYRFGYGLMRRNPDATVVEYKMPCEAWVVVGARAIVDENDPEICSFSSYSSLESAARDAIARGRLEPLYIYRPFRR